MKSIPKILLLLLIALIIFPQVTFAAWWNPLSWKVFNRTKALQVEIQKKDPPSEIEKSRNEVSELKKVKPAIQNTAKSVNTQSNHENQKPQTFKLPNGAIVDEQGNVLNKEDVDKVRAAEEQKRVLNDLVKHKQEENRIAEEQKRALDNLIKQKREESRIAQEQENIRRQAELQRAQEEQDKINHLNSLLAEYQQKINDIDAQILTIRQQYSVDYEKALNSGETVDYGQAMAARVTQETDSKIYQLQLRKEALRLEYLNKGNTVQ